MLVGITAFDIPNVEVDILSNFFFSCEEFFWIVVTATDLGILCSKIYAISLGCISLHNVLWTKV